MKHIAIALLAAISLAGCAPMSDSTATRALEAQGFTDIQLNGIAFFGCDKNDFFRTKFTAKGVKGNAVEGVVCGGFFKGATVRID